MRNGTKRIRRVLALATVVTALAAPAAWGATAEQLLSESSRSGNAGGNPQEQSYSPVSSIAPYVQETPPSSPPASVSGDGFDWVDAGVGATAMLALAAMAGGAALVLRNRPHRGSVA